MTYFFFVLTLFVGLIYYTLYPSNQITTIERPSSEQAITSFLAQHRGAVDYVNQRLSVPFLPFPRANAIGDGQFEVLQCTEIGPFANLERNDTDGVLIGSLPNECQDKQINACPTGTEGCELTPAKTTGFVSALFCLDASSNNEIVDCTGNTRKRRYVVTYGYDQYWWWDEFQGAALWREAILRRSHGSIDCGILALDGGFVLKNTSSRSDTTRPIPQKIIDALTAAGVNTYTHGSVWNIGQSYPRNTLMCITPVNEPYTTEGLIVSLDYYLNDYELDGTNNHVRFFHAEKPTAKWPDLASQYISTSATSNIKSVDLDNVTWHTLDGVTMDNDITEISHLKMSDLGNSFTISFVVRYQSLNNETTGVTTNFEGTFGFVNNGEGIAGGYCEETKKNVGEETETVQNVCFNVNPGTNTDTKICSPVDEGDVIQYTYIVDYDRQVLYKNNEVVDTTNIQPFTFFEKIADEKLSIGGYKDGGTEKPFIGGLYNFRVYNRVLTNRERQYNFEQDKKRYNINN